MSSESQDFQAVSRAIDEFQEAVKRHEHVRPLDSEVALRQAIDRCRAKLIAAIKDYARNSPG